MEEVDSIIIHFLSQLDIDISEDIKGLGDMPVELIIKSMSKCLKTINPSLKVPKTLPPGVSQRIEVAAQIAGFCKDLGYKNDVGYQTILYCNESDLRQVFMFLIEHLPSEGKNVTTTSTVKSVLLQNISKKIEKDLSTIWIPQSCQRKEANTIENYTAQGYQHNFLQINENALVEKLLKIKSLKSMNVEDSQVFQNNEQSEIQKTDDYNINLSIKELKETSIILRQKLDTLESERNIMDFEFKQAEKSYENADSELKNVVNILNSIGLQTSDIDSSIDVLEKVERNIEVLHVKSEELTSKNLSLKLEIDKYKAQPTFSDSERNKVRNILIAMKENAKALKDEYESKEKVRDELKKSYGKNRGRNKRSIYTKRILEIIGNVDKQNLEIKKVLDDTREMQKEINSLEGQLDRCFSIADETLFGDAKKDDQAKKAYKLLALLHSECNTIVSLINDTGTLAREIVDLEDNIKAEKTKRTEDTLEKIKLDLTKMQEE